MEDDDDLRDLVAEELSLQGAEIVKANSGISALEEYATHKTFDVILSDMRMPNGDGLYLIRSLRKTYKNVPPFVIVSGFSDFTEESMKKEGIAKIFDKPFIWDEFLAYLAQFLPKETKDI